MPLPKYKKSRSSTRDTKAQWRKKLHAPNLVECPQCHQLKLSHTACAKCGFYKGRNVITMKIEG